MCQLQGFRMTTVLNIPCTAQKMKFSIKDFFRKCDQIHSRLQIWPHLLKKSLMKNFILCAVHFAQLVLSCTTYFVEKYWKKRHYVKMHHSIKLHWGNLRFYCNYFWKFIIIYFQKLTKKKPLNVSEALVRKVWKKVWFPYV